MHALRIFLFFLFASLALAVEPNAFELANQRYDQGQFAEAKNLYESIAKSGHYNANVFYNLGNADFRLGDRGGAALHYERALSLDPGHPEARANLTFVRGETGAKIENRSWVETFFPAFTTNFYVLLATVAGWLALAAWSASFFRGTSSFAGVGWFAALVAIYAFAAVLRAEMQQSLAIVTAQRASARFAPADNATLADALPAGSHLHILSERGPWVYCELPNRERAWIATAEIERVSPGA